MVNNFDDLISQALFSHEPQKSTAIQNIFNTAEKNGVYPASLYDLYTYIGTHKLDSPFTVPAINIRTLTYDTARVIFRLIRKHNIGPVIFEIAKSEMNYTDQPPREYAAAILCAGLAESYIGPVFIQGDHFQLNKDHFSENREKEINGIETLITDAIRARYLNIDIDASTLVDLSKNSISDQQAVNAEVTAYLTSVIRKLQSEGQTIAIGGEIGHIGGKNSRAEDFRAFMEAYRKQISGEGISKVSVQTGSSHGGTPLPDGTVKKIEIDFSVLETIGHIAREQYGLGGAVQHGASTLPIELFSEFPKHNTVEIHLATGLQNSVYENMPEKLREEMYDYVKTNFSDERKPEMTDQQFIYSLRKKALGPFKKTLFTLRSEEKEPVLQALENQCAMIFEKLGVFNTRSLIEQVYHQ